MISDIYYSGVYTAYIVSDDALDFCLGSWIISRESSWVKGGKAAIHRYAVVIKRYNDYRMYVNVQQSDILCLDAPSSTSSSSVPFLEISWAP